MAYTSSVGISEKEDSTSMISSTSTWIASDGQEYNALEKVLLSELTTQLSSMMALSTSLQDTMAALDTMIFGSAHSKDRSINGSKSIPKVHVL